MSMKAHLALIGTALVLAACTPSTPVPAPSGPAPASASPTLTLRSPEPEPSAAPVKCAYPSTTIPDKVMVRDVFHAGSSVRDTCVENSEKDAYFEYLPDPCGHHLGVKTSSIVARR